MKVNKCSKERQALRELTVISNERTKAAISIEVAKRFVKENDNIVNIHMRREEVNLIFINEVDQD